MGQVIVNKINQEIVFARINTNDGLQVQNLQAQNLIIEHLVICISPSSKNIWDWINILQGVLQQVLTGQLKINRLVFISSTRVYDGIERGIVEASTQAVSHSHKGKSLLAAEQLIPQLADQYHILRCSGLYGEGYQKYLAILSECRKQQTRFAVSLDEVAEEVVSKIENGNQSSCSLLTDGYCYFEGKKISMLDAMSLSAQHKILRASCTEF